MTYGGKVDFGNICVEYLEIMMDTRQPVIPNEVQVMLASVGIVKKELSWKIHNGKTKFSVTLIWPKENPENNKASPQASAMTNSSIPCTSSQNAAGDSDSQSSHKMPARTVTKSVSKEKPCPTSINQKTSAGPTDIVTVLERKSPMTPHPIEKAKKKTPGRKRRDRRRLLKYRAVKMKQKNRKKSFIIRHYNKENSHPVTLHGGKIVLDNNSNNRCNVRFVCT